MAKRRGHDGRRDKYGRYKAKSGGIKAYKSNLPTMKAGKSKKKPLVKVNVSVGGANKKTGQFSKKRALIGAAIYGGIYAGVYVAGRKANGPGKTRVPSSPEVKSYAAKVSRGAPTGASFQSKSPFSQAMSAKTGGGAAQTSKGGFTMAQARAESSKAGVKPGYKTNAESAAKKAGQNFGGPLPGKKAPGKSTPAQSVKYIDDKSISKANATVKRYTAGDKSVSFDDYDKAQVHLAQADTIAQGHVYKGIKRRK